MSALQIKKYLEEGEVAQLPDFLFKWSSTIKYV